jgi:hypothetical protein
MTVSAPCSGSGQPGAALGDGARPAGVPEGRWQHGVAIWTRPAGARPHAPPQTRALPRPARPVPPTLPAEAQPLSPLPSPPNTPEHPRSTRRATARHMRAPHLAVEQQPPLGVPHDHAHALARAVELEDVEDLVIHQARAGGQLLAHRDGGGGALVEKEAKLLGGHHQRRLVGRLGLVLDRGGVSRACRCEGAGMFRGWGGQGAIRQAAGGPVLALGAGEGAAWGTGRRGGRASGCLRQSGARHAAEGRQQRWALRPGVAAAAAERGGALRLTVRDDRVADGQHAEELLDDVRVGLAGPEAVHDAVVVEVEVVLAVRQGRRQRAAVSDGLAAPACTGAAEAVAAAAGPFGTGSFASPERRKEPPWRVWQAAHALPSAPPARTWLRWTSRPQ